jgi:branched-chain amino acid transport system permease protein
MGDILYSIFADPFVTMWALPDFLAQVLWEGFVSGVLYALIALGFVLIFKASGVFNFAQGIMVVFSGLTLVGLHELGVPAWLALLMTLGVMYLLAVGVERLVLRKLVNQPDIILFMATIGLTNILIGLGQWIFGGETKTMITEELWLPTGSSVWEPGGGLVIFQHIDIAATAIAGLLIVGLAIFFSKTKVGRALRAVADDHQASLSVGISLNQIWVIVWFAAGIVALVTGIMWGARSDVSFSLQIIALKALPVLVLGGFTSIPGAIVGGLIIGIGEKLFEIYWGPLLGSGVEGWFAYVIALFFLLFRPQGLFGDKIIERV